MAEDQPLLDTDHFAELCDLIGGTQTEQLLRTFVIDLAERLPAILAMYAADRSDDARRSVHGLKGAALSIGARRIAMIAASIERADDPTQRDLYAELEACADATRSLIDALLLQD